MIGLYAEKKTQLSSLSLLLYFPEGSGSDTKLSEISIKDNTVSIEQHDSIVSFLLDQTTMLPSSCRGLLVNSHDELQLTIQYLDTNTNSKTTREHLSDRFTTQTKLIEEITQCGNNVYCCGCGQKLFNDHNKFNRILPLPSENWSDFADMWFCHKHEEEHHDKDSRPNGLKPKPNDCLVGTTYILINSNHIKTDSVSYNNTEVVCNRCGNCIGKGSNSSKSEKEADNIKRIYLHAVMFLSPTKKIQNLLLSSTSQKERLENYLSQLILEESRLFTSFRFIVKSSDSQGKSVQILLWLLDEYVEVFQCQSSNKINQVTSIPSVKVLYRCILSTRGCRVEDKAIYKLWERDNSVHLIDLPYTLSLHLISLLISSSKHLPFSTRQLNGFNVGLLQLQKT
ncbi:hypothetical protein LOTGIDRAFT_205133 [Lottia gigantea]|uniref:E3 ubiquitin-protein ligase E3D n=1 Tax=Lottia gigantea TaxID=225164 RepID=V4B6R9_LOTGI|nr:hypothetical protein LOTGIDRAFT_205133 [Lottia gigantea]ESP01787.1 hypothetical protein LOTGIDRAFT_205133 [Lottia gigantea]